jgi:uncharacterized protein
MEDFMDTILIDGQLFKKLVINGSLRLKNNLERINELNVFPVPDGDTGSNMSATMQAGSKSILAVEDNSIGAVAKILARGMLMGARGNSGVILSQLFSGMANGLKGIDAADAVQFSKALRQGVEQAYAAVINPVEGTILTVAREGADVALAIAHSKTTFEDLFSKYIDELNASLERTPDLLPILKEVGVIDSGGAGFIEVVLGMNDALKGKIYSDSKQQAQPIEKTKPAHAMNMDSFKDATDFGYCTEFIMQLEKVDEFSQKDFVEMISPLGDSLVVVQDDNILKVHIHTKTPGDALNLGQRFGFFINMKIENMTVQHTEVVMHQPTSFEEPCECGHEHASGTAPRVHKKYALIAVVNGDGLKDTFVEMGCDFIIDGGQTMNPSVEDFVKASANIEAENIIIIPNNKNVLLSAETAAKLIENKKVFVLAAKTIPQGYAALTMFDATQDPETNIKDMMRHIKNVKTGEITYAIRESINNGMKINKNDFMGIFNGEIVVSVKDRLEAAKALLKSMVDKFTEIVTIMFGADVEEDEVNEIADEVSASFPVEIEIINGGQDIYSYIISVE